VVVRVRYHTLYAAAILKKSFHSRGLLAHTCSRSGIKRPRSRWCKFVALAQSSNAQPHPWVVKRQKGWSNG
jgi:hypothetical protein